MSKQYYERLHANIVKNGGVPDFDLDEIDEALATAEARARELVGVYYQVSAKDRALARLPEGKTGVEALAEASGRPDWAQALGELSAGDQYLRCYAGRDGQRIRLSPLEFGAFKRLGGGTYQTSTDPPKTEIEQLRDAKRALETMTQRCRDFEKQVATQIINRMPRCVSCAHWDLSREPVFGARRCHALAITNKLMDNGPDNTFEPATAPDFGCTLWEKRQ